MLTFDRAEDEVEEGLRDAAGGVDIGGVGAGAGALDGEHEFINLFEEFGFLTGGEHASPVVGAEFADGFFDFDDIDLCGVFFGGLVHDIVFAGALFADGDDGFGA